MPWPVGNLARIFVAWKTLAIDESAFTQLLQAILGTTIFNSQVTAIVVSSVLVADASTYMKKQVHGRSAKGGGWALLSSHTQDVDSYVDDEDI